MKKEEAAPVKSEESPGVAEDDVDIDEFAAMSLDDSDEEDIFAINFPCDMGFSDDPPGLPNQHAATARAGSKAGKTGKMKASVGAAAGKRASAPKNKNQKS